MRLASRLDSKVAAALASHIPVREQPGQNEQEGGSSEQQALTSAHREWFQSECTALTQDVSQAMTLQLCGNCSKLSG